MSFWQKVLLKSTAILKAALALVLFIGVTYLDSLIFFYLGVDRTVYRGSFNFVSCVLVFVVMIIIHKVSSTKKEPLIKVKRISPDQAAALVVVALGMLGLVAAYLSIADRIAESKETVNEAIEEYRESVDRFSDVEQVVIPVWDSVLYVVTVSFIVPVSEEMTFRGVFFGQIRRAFGPWVTVIISAVGFGLMHGITIHIGYAIACGLVIAACYHLTDSIIAPILLHTVFNVFGSGIPTFMSIEYFGIPAETKSIFMRSINTTSIIFMPLSALAIAYLVSVKRKKAKEAAALSEINFIGNTDNEKLTVPEDAVSDGEESGAST